MSNKAKAGLIACGVYAGICMFFALKCKQRVKLNAENSKKRKAVINAIELWQGELRRQCDPYRNNVKELKIHNNHVDVNQNKDLGQK